jgi:ATP-binding cassette subfamily B protein
MPFKWLIVGQMLISILWAIDLSLSPYMIKCIIDAVAKYNPSTGDATKIWHYVYGYITLSAMIVVLFRFYDWILMKINSKLKPYISLTILKRTLLHAYSFYQNQLLGSLINKVTDITDHTANLLRLTIDHFLSHMLALFIAIFTMWMNAGTKYALALMVWASLFLWISSKLLVKAKMYSQSAAEVRSHTIGKITDLFRNVLSIHLLNKTNSEIHYINNHFQQFSIAVELRDWCFIRIYFFQKSSFFIFQSLCLWWLTQGIIAQTVQAGDFALILMINTAIAKCLWNLARDLKEFTESLGTVNAGLEVLYQPITIYYKEHSSKVLYSASAITFEHVYFNYENRVSIFENLSVTIRPSEKVGIVGYTGSGKSTFIKLLLRMYDVTEGRILIDQQDIRDISKTSLSNLISVIPQDLSLFNRSIIDNIKFGNDLASDEDAIEAAKIVEMDDYIRSLPRQYHTIVGENGTCLSGGQRQRILIARVILKKAPIIIFDEASNQLDMITDNKIQANLKQFVAESTTLIITHRLSTLMHVDRILVFDKGSIVQDGTHEELVAQKGLYAQLWSNTIDECLSG